jgi:hypothetical protein
LTLEHKFAAKLFTLQKGGQNVAPLRENEEFDYENNALLLLKGVRALGPQSLVARN